MHDYDRNRYWEKRAVHWADDPRKAVMLADERKNVGIEYTQDYLMRGAMAFLQSRLALSGAQVLDFGCGIGRWVEFFAGRGCKYSGVDISSGLLEVARRQHPSVDFRQVEEDRIPYPPESFDLVVSLGVIHHNQYEQQAGIFKEVMRVKKGGGYLLLLEAIGRHVSDPASITYPRPKQEWIVMMEQEHGLRCVWSRDARYWLLGSVLNRIRAPAFERSTDTGDTLQVKRRRNRLMTSLENWVTRIDAVGCPRLSQFLPERLRTRSLMVFV